MKLAIYGAGTMGGDIYELALRIKRASNRWDDVFFVDDTGKTEFCGAAVYPFAEAKKKFLTDELRFVISLGEPADREMLAERVESAGFMLETIVNDRIGELSDTVEIGQGSILFDASVSVGSFVRIGKNVLIQGPSNIGHRTVIGDHSNITPFNMICGSCRIGKCVFMGVRASVKEETTIGDYAIIGMGAIVARNVPENYTVMSAPSKMVPHERGTKALQGRYTG